jgi:hypothetical protein
MADENLYTVFCWVIGDPFDFIFPIYVSKTVNAASLKKTIVEENEAFHGADPRTLNLWKVSIAEEDLETQLEHVSRPSDIRGAEKLARMARVFSSPPEFEHLHIIVESLPGRLATAKAEGKRGVVFFCYPV